MRRTVRFGRKKAGNSGTETERADVREEVEGYRVVLFQAGDEPVSILQEHVLIPAEDFEFLNVLGVRMETPQPVEITILSRAGGPSFQGLGRKARVDTSLNVI